MDIRTPKGKFYGALDLQTYVMTVKDGGTVRRFPVSKSGCCLEYTAGRSPTEQIQIPPQPLMLQQESHN